VKASTPFFFLLNFFCGNFSNDAMCNGMENSAHAAFTSVHDATMWQLSMKMMSYSRMHLKSQTCGILRTSRSALRAGVWCGDVTALSCTIFDRWVQPFSVYQVSSKAPEYGDLVAGVG